LLAVGHWWTSCKRDHRVFGTNVGNQIKATYSSLMDRNQGTIDAESSETIVLSFSSTVEEGRASHSD
jgi:hypothetical protein